MAELTWQAMIAMTYVFHYLPHFLVLCSLLLCLGVGVYMGWSGKVSIRRGATVPHETPFIMKCKNCELYSSQERVIGILEKKLDETGRISAVEMNGKTNASRS